MRGRAGGCSRALAALALAAVSLVGLASWAMNLPAPGKSSVGQGPAFVRALRTGAD